MTKYILSFLFACFMCVQSVSASEEGVLNGYRQDILNVSQNSTPDEICLMLSNKYSSIGRNFKFKYNDAEGTVDFYVYSGSGYSIDYYKLFLTIPYKMM